MALVSGGRSTFCLAVSVAGFACGGLAMLGCGAGCMTGTAPQEFVEALRRSTSGDVAYSARVIHGNPSEPDTMSLGDARLIFRFDEGPERLTAVLFAPEGRKVVATDFGVFAIDPDNVIEYPAGLASFLDQAQRIQPRLLITRGKYLESLLNTEGAVAQVATAAVDGRDGLLLRVNAPLNPASGERLILDLTASRDLRSWFGYREQSLIDKDHVVTEVNVSAWHSVGDDLDSMAQLMIDSALSQKQYRSSMVRTPTAPLVDRPILRQGMRIDRSLAQAVREAIPGIDSNAGQNDLVLLYFWTTHCYPCDRLVRIVAELQNDPGADDLFIRGIAPYDDARSASDHLARLGISIPQVEMPPSFPRTAGVWIYPTLILMHSSGTLLWVKEGFDSDVEESLRMKIIESRRRDSIDR